MKPSPLPLSLIKGEGRFGFSTIINHNEILLPYTLSSIEERVG